jgi:hypothetical protein
MIPVLCTTTLFVGKTSGECVLCDTYASPAALDHWMTLSNLSIWGSAPICNAVASTLIWGGNLGGTASYHSVPGHNEWSITLHAMRSILIEPNVCDILKHTTLYSFHIHRD